MGCKSGFEITLSSVDQSTELGCDFGCPASWVLYYVVTEVVLLVTELSYL